MLKTISIIVPVLNEAGAIDQLLRPLQRWRRLGHEVIVVDGGSADDTVACSRSLADRVLSAPRGRARQMNAGAAVAQGDVLLFLHADTQLPDDAATRIIQALGRPVWGRFDVRLSGRPPLLRLVETLMNWRSRLTGIATGDQAVFVERRLFHAAGGYPDQALMEDIALSKALKRYSRPACLRTRVVTSSRRWERFGIWRTILLMWRLRLAYFLGADPAQLAKRYRVEATGE